VAQIKVRSTYGRSHIFPPNPPCPQCRVQAPRPMLVTTRVVHYRCTECGNVWSIDKPDESTP
jgi:uncharacterized Zn finger protein